MGRLPCSAASPEIPGLQQELLRDDGTEVFWNGNIWCVDLKEFGWKNTVEEAERFLPLFMVFVEKIDVF